MIHQLKVDPEFWHDISIGNKRFELRKNDRDFQLWDTLVLSPFDRTKNEYVKDVLAPAYRTITYILKGEKAEALGLQPGYCILQIK